MYKCSDHYDTKLMGKERAQSLMFIGPYDNLLWTYWHVIKFNLVCEHQFNIWCKPNMGCAMYYL
jgi:hypothetical protein